MSQDVPYPVQLERKRLELARLLRAALGGRAPRAAGHRHAGGRRRHAVAVQAQGGVRLRLRSLEPAHARHGSLRGRLHRIVPVDTCPVHSDRANRLAFMLRDRLLEARIPPAGPDLEGILRHVVIRTTRDEREAVVMLVVTRNDKALRRPLRAFLGVRINNMQPQPNTGT